MRKPQLAGHIQRCNNGLVRCFGISPDNHYQSLAFPYCLADGTFQCFGRGIDHLLITNEITALGIDKYLQSK